MPAGRDNPGIVAFLDELRTSGFAEGRNLIVIPGGFDVRSERIAEVAAAMVGAEPDAIVAGPDPQLNAVRAATRAIPIIGMTEDMVAGGHVTSLARPGGNTTGISLLSPELDGKRQDLLIEAVPKARRIAVIEDARVSSPAHLEALRNGARPRGVELAVFGVSNLQGVIPAIDAAKHGGADAVHFLTGPLFAVPGSPQTSGIVDRLARLRLPSVHQWPDTVDEGGLLGYGARFTQVWRQRAQLTARVLRGAKPADVPVEQPTRFELAINLKAAKAIGHEVPAGLVLRADKLIE